MFTESPPPEMEPLIRDYLLRSFTNVSRDLAKVNGVAIVAKLPDKPKPGKIYFLDVSTETFAAGLWYYQDFIWSRLATSAELQAGLDALDERLTILEEMLLGAP